MEEECYFCGYNKIIHKHHLITKKMGGGNEDENKICLCPNCHYLLHTHKYFIYWLGGVYFMINKKDGKDVIVPINFINKEKKSYPKESINKLYSEQEEEGEEEEIDFDELLGQDIGIGDGLTISKSDGKGWYNFEELNDINKKKVFNEEGVQSNG